METGSVFYGKEPFDLRLTVLRLLRRLPAVAAVTAVGTLLLGGGYYLKNVVFSQDRVYAARSVYHVEYAVEEERDVATVYINETSWNTYLGTRSFLDSLQRRMEELNREQEFQLTLEDDELREALTAVLASDLRVPSVTAATDSPEKSVRIAQAVERVMTLDFPEGVREIDAITVIDPGDTAPEVIPDVRPGRAFLLAAVVSLFFGVAGTLWREVWADSIWLPSTLVKRYGLKTLGTIESRELGENTAYLFAGKTRVAVCGLQESSDGEQALEQLRAARKQPRTVKEQPQAAEDLLGEWFVAPSPLLDPAVCRTLREADGVLLVVRAGAHAGRRLEHALMYLEQQDCKITAVLLWKADQRLIREYEWGLGKKRTGMERL